MQYTILKPLGGPVTGPLCKEEHNVHCHSAKCELQAVIDWLGQLINGVMLCTVIHDQSYCGYLHSIKPKPATLQGTVVPNSYIKPKDKKIAAKCNS